MDKNIENKNKNKLNSKRIVVYVLFLMLLMYLLYAIYLLVKDPANKVTVEQRNIIFGRNKYWLCNKR